MTTWLSRSGVLGLLVSLALAPHAVAAGGVPPPKAPTFALSTDARVLAGEPGQVLHGAVLVRNLTGHPVAVRLQAADIRNATNGNADFVSTPLSGAGRWLHITVSTLRLLARATGRVTYTVSVPPTATGASHYAGIVAVDVADLARGPAPRKAKRTSFTFKRINRQALPLTVRLPGPLSHRLVLRSVKLSVQPAGAGLLLGIVPRGSELIPTTDVDLRVSRGLRTVLTYSASLGQLFPDSTLDYRIPWEGRPTEGTYHVVGVIRPEGAPAVTIDRTVAFTADNSKELEHETPPGPQPPALPLWMWMVLAAAGTLLTVALLAVWRLKRELAAQAR
jgi:hypothetical protein